MTQRCEQRKLKLIASLRKMWRAKFAFSFLIIISGRFHFSGGVRWYVKPTNDSCNFFPKDAVSCETLSTYAMWKNVTNSTEFVFLPGKHVLLSNFTVSCREDIKLISNASVAGESETHSVEILCDKAGFKFEDILNLSIVDLTFTKCNMNNSNKFVRLAYTKANESIQLVSGLFLNRVTNANITRVLVQNTTGFGLFMNNNYGHSSITNSTIQHCRDSECHIGGNAVFNCMSSDSDKETNQINILLTIEDSQFLYGVSNSCSEDQAAPGLVVALKCDGVNVSIRRVITTGNSGYNISRCKSRNKTAGNVLGGNMAIFFKKQASVVIENSSFSQGEAVYGGGLFVQYAHNKYSCLEIRGCDFKKNMAYANGGGLHFEMNHPEIVSSSMQCNSEKYHVVVNNTVFTDNKVQTYQDAGIALSLTYFYGTQYFLGNYAKYSTVIDQCSFNNSTTEAENQIYSSGSAALYISQWFGRLVIRNSNITNNKAAGLAAFRSLINFQGQVNIFNNTGQDGGGIILCEASYFVMSSHTILNISSNRAFSSGGGIFAESRCVQVQPLCIYQIEQDENQKLNDFFNTTSIILENNTAAFAGTQIYGGTLDQCKVPHISEDIFPKLFKFLTKDISYVSSDPLNVCFCSEDGRPDCTKNDTYLNGSTSIYSGQGFNVSLVIVGQYDGTVPGTVEVRQHDEGGSNLDSEDIQTLNRTCSQHTILFYTKANKVSIKLKVKNVHATYKLNVKQTLIHVEMKDPPVGFESTSTGKPSPYLCQAKKELNITESGFKCLIKGNKSVIQRPPGYWLGYDRGFVLYEFCPTDNCKHYLTEMNADHSHNFTSNSTFYYNDQCAYNHVGTLCGQCKKDYSLVIGSLQCRNCTHITVMKTIGISLGLALVGVLAILLMLIFNVTVTQGTLSEFLFYINVFYIFRVSLFPSYKDAGNLSYLHSAYTGFVSFMNLVYTYNQCYYNGLDMSGYCWIHFLMIFYLWGITGLFIWLCKRFSWLSNRITNLKNMIPILATVILLSYTNVSITVIYSVMFARLHYPGPNGRYDITKVVMWYDGNVDYFSPKHIPLLIVGYTMGVLSFVFMLLLLLLQPLQRYSHLKLFRWVNKLKPLLDAYTCPHIIKPNCRFWNGFLLLVRAVLYCLFTTDTRNAHHQVLTLGINIACLVILATAFAFGGVYTKPHLNLLSSSYVVNMAVLSAVALYYYVEGDARLVLENNRVEHDNARSIMTAALVSLTLVILTFSLTVVYHGYTQVRQFACCHYLWPGKWVLLGLGGREGGLRYQALESYVHSTAEESDTGSEVPTPEVIITPPGSANHSQYREPQLLDFDSLKPNN